MNGTIHRNDHDKVVKKAHGELNPNDDGVIKIEKPEIKTQDNVNKIRPLQDQRSENKSWNHH